MGERYERFTERAQKALILAGEEARRFNHNYVGTEHLLLGLAREGEGVAARILAHLGADLPRVREAFMFLIGRVDRPVIEGPPFTPRAKRALQWAVEEAMPLNHSYVGTEHLLLALTRRSPEGEKQPAVVLVLEQLGLDPEHVRRQVLEVVGGRPGAGGARLGELPVALPLGPGGPLGPRPRDNVVTCRVDDHLLNALDALVEAGVYTTRSEAAARLIAAGLEANQPLMEKVYAAVAEIRRVRAQMQSLAEQLKAEPSSASREGEEPADDAPQAGL